MVSGSRELSLEYKKSEEKKKKRAWLELMLLEPDQACENLSQLNTETLTSVCQKGIPGPHPLDRSHQSL